MAFFPVGADIPVEFRTADLVLRMLAPEHVERDYEAIMETRVRLRAWIDGDWPADDFTLAGNLDDMQMHEREFLAREAFAFTVLSADESRVEGCVYIQQLGRLLRRREVVSQQGPEPLPDAAAAIRFWVRDSALPRDLDRQLLEGLVRWLAEDWPFERAMFLINASQSRDHRILSNMSLPRIATLRSHDTGLEWELWEIPIQR